MAEEPFQVGLSSNLFKPTIPYSYMSAKNLLLLLVSMLIAFYLEIGWLVTLLAIVLFLFAIASIKREKPKTVAVPKGGEDVIHPVIYENTGEPPYLYPKSMKVKVIPEWYGGESMWENAIYGMGNIFKSGIRWLTGGKKEEKEEEEK